VKIAEAIQSAKKGIDYNLPIEPAEGGMLLHSGSAEIETRHSRDRWSSGVF
jgi:hypothetical protein